MRLKYLAAGFLAFAVANAGRAGQPAVPGSDGALVLNTPGTFVFDPHAFRPPLNPSVDNVFHFTHIYIGRDVVVKLSGAVLHNPVFWLAEDQVVIEGTVDLSGSIGSRIPADAGAGGFPGGVPGELGYAPSGNTKRNLFLVPLFGGSGGNGGTSGGGGGGGGLLISSAASITVDGTLRADGGDSQGGSGGDGGAIRLVAPLISGSGGISAKGGKPDGRDGLIRFECSQNLFMGTAFSTPLSRGKPLGLFLPTAPPQDIRLVSVSGQPATNGNLTFSTGRDAVLGLQSRNVAPGTAVTLECFSVEGEKRALRTTPFTGKFELGYATASGAFPPGIFSCQVRSSISTSRNGP